MGRRRLLVTDLDGTLVGDDAALDRFRTWVAGSRSEHRLVYATGRHRPSLVALMEEAALPRPDALVSAVGTEIHDAEGRPWPGWTDRFAGWHAERVRQIVRGLPWLEPQVDACQSWLKASYTVTRIADADLGLIRRMLRDAGIVATLTYSGGENLDVLPAAAGKGRAARFLADGWGIPPSDVLAFGDSGNDAEMLNAGFRGTIVANALPELRDAVGSEVYRSPAAFADGVLDGIRHWGDIEVREVPIAGIRTAISSGSDPARPG